MIIVVGHHFGLTIFSILIFNLIVGFEAGEVVCYYGSWAKNRPGNGKFAIEDIQAEHCSIVIYCCVGLNDDTTVNPYDAESDLPTLLALRKSNPNVRLLATLGGPNEQSETYSTMADSPDLRSAFVDNVVEFLSRHKLDGMDFMWEYPSRNGGKPADKTNFASLLQSLRVKFTANGWLLTAAVGANEFLIDTSYDVDTMNEALDYINIKTFDYYSSSDRFVYVHSPLYAPADDLNRISLTQNGTISQWLEAGFNREKIILGLAAYGLSFQLSSRNKHGLLASADGPGPAGPYSGVKGMLTYLEICEKLKDDSFNEQEHNEIFAFSAYRDLEWIGFDNSVSIREKARYARSMRLAGVSLYWIDGDDHNNVCGESHFPLLSAIRSVFPPSEDTTTVRPAPPVDQITKEEAISLCISGQHGTSFTNPLSSCSDRYYRCLRATIDMFIPLGGKCSAPLVFDSSTRRCNHRQNVAACKNEE